MEWTRPTWPIAVDVVAYGIVLLVMLVGAGLSRAFGS